MSQNPDAKHVGGGGGGAHPTASAPAANRFWYCRALPPNRFCNGQYPLCTTPCPPAPLPFTRTGLSPSSPQTSLATDSRPACTQTQLDPSLAHDMTSHCYQSDHVFCPVPQIRLISSPNPQAPAFCLILLPASSPSPLSLSPSLPLSLSPSLPLSRSPSLPLSLPPSLPLSLPPSLPLSLSPSLPLSLSPSLPPSLSPSLPLSLSRG